MTEWDEMLDQTLRRYANPPQPAGLDARIVARAEQRRRRRILLIFAPLATACTAAVVAAVMLVHGTQLRHPTDATVTVATTKNIVAPAFAGQKAPRLAPTLHVRQARQRSEASAFATSLAPVFPVSQPLTGEERRMQALARGDRAIVPPDEPELVISQLNIQPLKISQEDPGANNEQTEP